MDHRVLFSLWERVGILLFQPLLNGSGPVVMLQFPRNRPLPRHTHTLKGYIMDIIATPAYGRDYKTANDVRIAWQEGMDFQIVGIHPDSGRYINMDDAKRHANGSQVWIRYNNQTDKIKVHG